MVPAPCRSPAGAADHLRCASVARAAFRRFNEMSNSHAGAGSLPLAVGGECGGFGSVLLGGVWLLVVLVPGVGIRLRPGSVGVVLAVVGARVAGCRRLRGSGSRSARGTGLR